MADPIAGLATALADRYRIERELGAGGMATVYPAEDLKHHRRVGTAVSSSAASSSAVSPTAVSPSAVSSSAASYLILDG